MDFHTEPRTEGEIKLLEEMIEGMGHKTAIHTWRVYSIIFTTPVNCDTYKDNFHQERENFIRSKYEEDKKVWP